jgi:3-dehydrosphinganine reductase
MWSWLHLLLLLPVWLPCAALSLAWALNALWAVPLAALFALLARLLTCASGDGGLPMRGAVVLVTGGSSGIGKAVAKLAVQRGAAKVVLVARNQARLDDAKREIEEVAAAAGRQGGGGGGGGYGSTDSAAASSSAVLVETISVDLTSSADAVSAALLASPTVAGGRVDYLVLSAGDSGPSDFDAIRPADWERLLRLNVLGCVWAARAVVPAMKARARGGRLVLVSSMAGQVGVYGFTAYSASKFALRGLAEALRMELRPWGVGVSLVLPPDTDTPLLARENESKPVECRRISEGAGLFSAEAVAATTVDGMVAGHHLIGFGLDGFMLNTLTVGMLPSNSLAEGVGGLFLWPLFRMVGFGYTAMYDGICHAEAAKKPGWAVANLAGAPAVTGAAAGGEDALTLAAQEPLSAA